MAKLDELTSSLRRFEIDEFYDHIRDIKDDPKKLRTFLEERIRNRAYCDDKTADFAEALIQEGSSYDEKTLAYAVAERKTLTALVLIKAGANPKHARIFFSECVGSPLFIAVENGDLEMVKMLIEQGCDINEKERRSMMLYKHTLAENIFLSQDAGRELTDLEALSLKKERELKQELEDVREIHKLLRKKV